MRRALARAGRKAAEVDHMFVAAPVDPGVAACRALARRALGPHGEAVPVSASAIAVDRAVRLATSAARMARGQPDPGWRLAVCVGLGPSGSTVALCLRRCSGR